jgi:hypothetical protein
MGQEQALFPIHRGARAAAWSHATPPLLTTEELESVNVPTCVTFDPETEAVHKNHHVKIIQHAEPWGVELAEKPGSKIEPAKFSSGATFVLERPPKLADATLLGAAQARAPRPDAVFLSRLRPGELVSIGFADDSELTAGAFREEVNANVSHAETMDRWMVRSYKKPTSSGKSGESLLITFDGLNKEQSVDGDSLSDEDGGGSPACVLSGKEGGADVVLLACKHAICVDLIQDGSVLRRGSSIICPACGEVHEGTQDVPNADYCVCKRKAKTVDVSAQEMPALTLKAPRSRVSVESADAPIARLGGPKPPQVGSKNAPRSGLRLSHLWTPESGTTALWNSSAPHRQVTAKW